MKCTRPTLIKKTVSWLPPEKYPLIYVPCGKCLACRVNRTRQWTKRLLDEQIYSTSSYFVTLTYDDEHLPRNDSGDGIVCKRDIQLFLKRLRKRDGNNNIRYFICSEYGPQTFRPHYHCCIFNVGDFIIKPIDFYDNLPHTKINEFGETVYINTELTKIWGNGSTEVSELIRERASYCAKYTITRKHIPEYLEPNFSLISKGHTYKDGRKTGGIGYQHIDNIRSKVRYYGLHSLLTDTGNFVALPKYYKQKIYTQNELEQQFFKRLADNPTGNYASDFFDNSDIVEQQQQTDYEFHNHGKRLI